VGDPRRNGDIMAQELELDRIIIALGKRSGPRGDIALGKRRGVWADWTKHGSSRAIILRTCQHPLDVFVVQHVG